MEFSPKARPSPDRHCTNSVDLHWKLCTFGHTQKSRVNTGILCFSMCFPCFLCLFVPQTQNTWKRHNIPVLTRYFCVWPKAQKSFLCRSVFSVASSTGSLSSTAWYPVDHTIPMWPFPHEPGISRQPQFDVNKKRGRNWFGAREAPRVWIWYLYCMNSFSACSSP